jgi:hypothetical protein
MVDRVLRRSRRRSFVLVEFIAGTTDFLVTLRAAVHIDWLVSKFMIEAEIDSDRIDVRATVLAVAEGAGSRCLCHLSPSVVTRGVCLLELR